MHCTHIHQTIVMHCTDIRQISTYPLISDVYDSNNYYNTFVNHNKQHNTFVQILTKIDIYHGDRRVGDRRWKGWWCRGRGVRGVGGGGARERTTVAARAGVGNYGV